MASFDSSSSNGLSTSLEDSFLVRPTLDTAVLSSSSASFMMAFDSQSQPLTSATTPTTQSPGDSNSLFSPGGSPGTTSMMGFPFSDSIQTVFWIPLSETDSLTGLTQPSVTTISLEDIEDGNTLASLDTTTAFANPLGSNSSLSLSASQSANTTLQRAIFWNNPSTGESVLWYTNDPTWKKGYDGNNSVIGAFATLPLQTNLKWKFQTTGNFSGDAQGQTDDLLWRNQETGALQVWVMNGTIRTQIVNLAVAVPDSTWRIQGAGDFDGDGRDDIVWRNYSTGRPESGSNAVWLMRELSGQYDLKRDGNGVAQALPILSLNDPTWQIQGVGDFNNDGKPDIVWRNTTTGDTPIWLLNSVVSPNPVSYGYLPVVDGQNWKIRGTSDFNNDGKADLLWQNQTTGENAAWYVDGTHILSGVAPNYGWDTPGISPTPTNFTWLTRTASNQPWQSYGSYTFYETNPTVTAGLANDTAIAGTNTDLITSDPTISGQVTGDRTTSVLKAKLGTNTNTPWTTITSSLPASGQFTLSQAQLQQLNGGTLLVDGTYTVQLQAQDIHWNQSSVTSLTFTLDTLAPAMGSTITLATSSDTGRSNSDQITSQKTPPLSGTAQANTTVQVFDGVQKIGQTTSNATGVWQVTPTLLADGLHNLTAKAVDVAGNASSVTTPLALTIDTQVPTTPTALRRLTNPFDAAPNTVTIGGMAEVNATVTLYEGTQSLGESLAASDGSWSITTLQLGGGLHALTATATDAAGNTSSQSSSLSVDPLTPAPRSTLTLVPSSDTGWSTSDQITSQKTPTLSGTAPANTTVQVFDGAQKVGQTTSNAAGVWQVTTSLLADGLHSLTAKALDVAGNASPTTTPLALTIDTQAPTAPTALRRLTNSFDAVPNTVTIGGMAEANAMVTLYQGTQALGESFAASDGSWSVTTLQLGGGLHTLTATTTDVAGNTSIQSSSLSVDHLPAPAPRGLRLAPESDSGVSNSDGITNSTSLTMVGTAEAGATVKLWNDDQTFWGQGQADASGNWRIPITPALIDNTYRLTATATNANGKSASSEGFNLTIDRTAPIVTLTPPLGGSTPLTPNTRLNGTINGTGSASASVTYRFGTGAVTAIQTPANGLFNSLLMLNGVSGSQSLTMTATDVAGNQSTPLTYALTVNSTDTIPDTPVLVADLTQDTGISKSDRLTTDASISGVVSARNPIVGLQAALVGPSELASGVADPMGNAFFQDITATIDAGGNFSLSQSQLVDLYGKDLVDGTYTLKLQAKDGQGNFSQEVRVTFTLDLTAPTQNITSLIDGISWEHGTHLQGTVQDNLSEVEVSYQIKSVTGTSLGSNQAVTVTSGAFDQALTELAVGNATLQEETPYSLLITSTDRAGNTERSRFQFFIPSKRQVTDDDTLPGHPTNPTDPIPTLPPTSGNVNSWGYVGGGGWGYWGAPGGTSSFTPSSGVGFDLEAPKPKDNSISGSGYEYDYDESIFQLVNQAANLISTDPATITKKAALINRQGVLQAIGERLETLIKADGNFTNDQGLIDRMGSAMEGLFAEAYAPQGDKAGVESRFVLPGGAWLAQALVSDPLSVRVQVFQATLLAAVTETTLGVTDATQQKALASAVMELAETYAWLNPNPEATVPVGKQDFGFLDALWRLQIPDANGQFKGGGDVAQVLGNSVTALGRLLEGVHDPVRAIQFLNNLVQAASNVTSLKGDVQDATFLRELVEFGVKFVKINPTVNLAATDTAVQGFLDRLWRGDTQQMKQSQSGLSAFFGGMGTKAEKIKGLEFADNLLDAAELLQVEGLASQKHDPTFLDALVELGGAYAALNPNTQQNLDEALTPLHSVLAQLYPDGEVMEASAVSHLESYLQQAGESSESMELSTLFLRSFRNDSRYVNQWDDLNWINSFLSVTQPYDKSILISNDSGFMPASSMERSLNANEIKYLRDTFGNSLDYSQVIITRGSLVSINGSKTIGNTIYLADTWGVAIFQEDGKSLTPQGLILLSHEITHVWQWQNGGSAYIPQSLVAQFSAFLRGGDRDGAYNWKDAYSKGLVWKDWNPEQQAQAMEDYNRAIQAVYRNEKGKDLEEAKENILTLTPYVLKVRQRQGAPVFRDDIDPFLHPE